MKFKLAHQSEPQRGLKNSNENDFLLWSYILTDEVHNQVLHSHGRLTRLTCSLVTSLRPLEDIYGEASSIRGDMKYVHPGVTAGV